jgi:sigma-E factor negative regulatory protein RseC
MINETGNIIELKTADVALVLCQKNSACAHCSAEGVCHPGESGEARTVEVYNPIGAQVGDQVRLSVTTRSFLSSSFLLYIVPLIALIVGAVIGKEIAPFIENGLDANVLSAIIGTGLMALSFVGIRIATRLMDKKDYMPRITAVIRGE